MYFAVVVSFSFSVLVFAKKDYANTKQRARKELQKDMEVGAQEAAADKIFGLFRWRCLSFFSTDFVSFFRTCQYGNMKHLTTLRLRVCRLFYISLFIFCFVHPQPGLVFVFVLVQQPSNISKAENAPKASMCARVCAKVKRKWQSPVWRAEHVCVSVGGCVLFSISHLVSAGGKRFRFELWVRDVINGQRCFGVLSKAILHRDWWRWQNRKKRIRQSRA